MLIGGVITGRILDGEYRRLKQRAVAAAEKELDPEKRSREEDVATSEKFPIEHARLRLTPIYLIVLVATCVGQGWAIDKGANLAAPLILQFFFGWATIAMMNIAQTLTVDLVPGQSASVSACNNLLRSSTGAVCVSVIDLILSALGTGWTYVLLAGICAILSPILLLTYHMGPKWRAQKRASR